MTDVETARRRLSDAMHAMHANSPIVINETLARELDQAWAAYDVAVRGEGPADQLTSLGDLADRLQRFVMSLGIDGTVYYPQPAASGKSWSFTVVQIDHSLPGADKRRFFKVRVSQDP